MLSDEIIKKSYILKDFTDKDVSLNIFGKLFTSIYDLSENYVHYYPRNLILQLVSGCNLRCKHCFFAENVEKTPEISQILPKSPYFSVLCFLS